VFGARAGRAAVGEPPADARAAQAAVRSVRADPAGSAAPSPESRRSLWVNAGLERDAAGLNALTADPHPLVRLIARSALARTESRGAHQRRDFPSRDAGFDGRHVTVREGGAPTLEAWD
jgi:L-aspartate oxidase